jgi:signal transduction histidine kinase
MAQRFRAAAVRWLGERMTRSFSSGSSTVSLNSPPPESRSLGPASSSEDSEPGRILIIDDQPSARAWARLILEHEFVCFTTGSAQEFLELAHRQSPDIFLADLEMQPISGIQLCRMIKSYPALAAVPFILLTAHESTDNKVASLSDGVDDHLPKSISPRELLSRIRATIRLRRAMLRTANLQGLVELRTHELRAATERLEAEIAERERIEAELRLAQKLEAVGQLAAGIAHEINTPLQYVGDSVQFLKGAFDDLTLAVGTLQELVLDVARTSGRGDLERSVAEVNETSDLEYLAQRVPEAFVSTLGGIQRISNIVRAMKGLAHPGQEEKAAADLNAALEAALTVTRNEYKYVADVESDFGELPPVHCHISQLNQVFVNLIVNAAHAIGEVVGNSAAKGHIRVSTFCRDRNAFIVIEDTGCGIPDKFRDRIFDPFFTTKPVGKGSGQGLSISHGIIVRGHHGRLTFDSEPGRGTRFVIEIPIDGRDGPQLGAPLGVGSPGVALASRQSA